MISIIVAFPKIEDANKIKALLVKSGFFVHGICNSGASVIQMAEELECELIICGCRFPDMTCHDIKKNIPINTKLLVLASKRVWDAYGGDDILFLEMPLKMHELINTLEMIIRAKRKARKKVENKHILRNNEEKELIVRAKLMLMERNNLSEEDAYRYIQKSSMDSGNSMADTASMLLSIMDVTVKPS